MGILLAWCIQWHSLKNRNDIKAPHWIAGNLYNWTHSFVIISHFMNMTLWIDLTSECTQEIAVHAGFSKSSQSYATFYSVGVWKEKKPTHNILR